MKTVPDHWRLWVGWRVSFCRGAQRLPFSALPHCCVSSVKCILSPSSHVIVTLLSIPFYFPLQNRQIRTRREHKWEILQSQFSARHGLNLSLSIPKRDLLEDWGLTWTLKNVPEVCFVAMPLKKMNAPSASHCEAGIAHTEASFIFFWLQGLLPPACLTYKISTSLGGKAACCFLCIGKSGESSIKVKKLLLL